MRRYLSALLAASILFSSVSAFAETISSSASFGAPIGDTSAIDDIFNTNLPSIGMTVSEANREISNLAFQYESAVTDAEKDAIFAQIERIALALKNEAHISSSTYNDIKEKRENPESVSQKNIISLDEIVSRLSVFRSKASLVGMPGPIVNGVQQAGPSLSEDDKDQIIFLFESALAPGCIEGGSLRAVSTLGGLPPFFYGKCGSDEKGIRIDELCQQISNLDIYKDDEDFIEESKLCFSDVTQTDWFYNYVMTMASRGYVEGKVSPVDGVGMFCPQDTITRAEFIAVIIRMMYPEQDFDAESNVMWWQPYYEQAGYSGIIHIDDYNKDPDMPITREEMAYIALKAIATDLGGKYPSSKIDSTYIKDFVQISEEYKDHVKMAYDAHLLTGDENGNFNPADNLTRAEASAVFYRFLEISERNGYSIWEK